MAKSKKTASASTPTKAQLVEAFNMIAAEPVEDFKTVKAAKDACQAVLNEYDETDIGAVPEETREILAAAGLKLPEPASAEEVAKPRRKRGEWGSHCHERVFQAMVDAGNEPMTKAQIAEKAITTEAVVSNAFYDFRRGDHTPEGYGKVAVNKDRSSGELCYFLALDEEQSDDAAALQEDLMS